MIQAGQLVMKDFLGVAASVSREVLKKMRFRIDAKCATSKYIVVVFSARADNFFRDQVRHVVCPG
jgi:hypothetical protein